MLLALSIIFYLKCTLNLLVMLMWMCLHCCSDESGVIYALDMGGTNFRVVTVTLSKRANRVVSIPLCCARAVGLQAKAVINNSYQETKATVFQALHLCCRAMWT